MRSDYAVIHDWIPNGARVLDLGCGDGSLLKELSRSRNTSGYGIEIDQDYIPTCIRAGINVIQSDLDEGLADFDADSFDYVILSLTLPAMRYPEKLLDEMLRVGKEGIVTFPNFAHWYARLHLLLRGRMPVTKALPHRWHNTPNIHLCTIHDFETLCEERKIEILERSIIGSSPKNRNPNINFAANLLGEIALYRFTRGGH